MSNKVIPYGKQEIREEDIGAVVETLKSDFLTQGPKVKEFEDAFANYVGAKHAVSFTNATAALHAAVQVLGLNKSKKVITTPNTFVASANCILYAGGEVQFCDIDSKTFNLDPNLVEDLVKKNPNEFSGIIPVDFAGLPSSMKDFKAIAEKYGLWLIEDACHAPGAAFEDDGVWQKIGNARYSEICSFSFHPVKHIACGEGGMLTTNSDHILKKLHLLRSHGITKDPAQMTEVDGGWDMEMQELGYNYRMPDILCALGLSQLHRAEKSLENRKRIAERYLEELGGLPLQFQIVPAGLKHAYHLFVIRTAKRKELYDFLKTKNIYAQVHYIPIHQQPYYVSRYGKQSFKEAENYYRECLSIPMYHSLTESDQTRVIEAISEFFKR
jgi:UDP-4-amino-4,6-dideoxy-N-acetyl-beta-L-altrosamine transaminase